MKSEAQREHQWLQKLVGDWDFEGEAVMGPGQPPAKCNGSETVRPLGDLWTLAEGQGEMPGGGPMRSLMTLGYDPHRKRFVGTFVASMMTHLWIYDGALDASGRVLALETEGPGMGTGEAMAKYRDVIEIAGVDERSLTSNMLGDDGKWHEFMVARYRRRK